MRVALKLNLSNETAMQNRAIKKGCAWLLKKYLSSVIKYLFLSGRADFMRDPYYWNGTNCFFDE